MGVHAVTELAVPDGTDIVDVAIAVDVRHRIVVLVLVGCLPFLAALVIQGGRGQACPDVPPARFSVVDKYQRCFGEVAAPFSDGGVGGSCLCCWSVVYICLVLFFFLGVWDPHPLQLPHVVEVRDDRNNKCREQKQINTTGDGGCFFLFR